MYFTVLVLSNFDLLKFTISLDDVLMYEKPLVFSSGFWGNFNFRFVYVLDNLNFIWRGFCHTFNPCCGNNRPGNSLSRTIGNLSAFR